MYIRGFSGKWNMAITYHIQVEGDLLRVTASGFDESLVEVLEYGQAVLAAAITHQCPRVLCDERALEYRLSTLDTYELADVIAGLAPKVARIAVVCDPEGVADADFFENVAVNRGLMVKAFKTLDAAQDWLRE